MDRRSFITATTVAAIGLAANVGAKEAEYKLDVLNRLKSLPDKDQVCIEEKILEEEKVSVAPGFDTTNAIDVHIEWTVRNYILIFSVDNGYFTGIPASGGSHEFNIFQTISHDEHGNLPESKGHFMSLKSDPSKVYRSVSGWGHGNPNVKSSQH